MQSNNEASQTRERVDESDDLTPKSFSNNLRKTISDWFSESSYSKLIGDSIGAVATVALALAFPLSWINLGILVATGCGVGAIDKAKNRRSFFEGFLYGIVGSIVLTSFLSLVVPHMLSALLFYGILPSRFVAPMLAAWPLIQTFLPMAILAVSGIAEFFKPRALINTFDFLSNAIVKLTTLITTAAGRMINAVINRCCPTLLRENGQLDSERRRQSRSFRDSTATYMGSKERPGGFHSRPGDPAAERRPADQTAQGSGLSRELSIGDKQQQQSLGETTAASPRSPRT